MLGTGSASAVSDTPLPASTLPTPVGTSPVARGAIIGPTQDLTWIDKTTVSLAKFASYSSTDATRGSAVTVTGSFVIPQGTPPPGGWPVVVIAHPTIGLTNNCGIPNLPVAAYVALPIVTPFTSLGYAVAIPDYEGLGPNGTHRYLDPRAAAYNVIDAVRAFGKLSPAVSKRWLVVGNSQGGHAAWAADEYNSLYGQGLSMVAAVAINPVANVTAFPALAAAGRLSANQRALATALAYAAVQSSNGTLTLKQLIPGVTQDQITSLIGCGPDRPAVAASITAAQVTPADSSAVTSYQAALSRLALPQRRLSVPLRVIQSDRDDVILPSWNTFAIRAARAAGGSVSQRVQVGGDHQYAKLDATDFAWIAGVFAQR
ncbi:lipase family protein [Williamsia sp. CHRR-6]|uniref:lipase family protein n=1 Tax=Williamsia sp. CHRR-6 TaxID=2835871 RepID=UPI001BDA8818|nr:lipase family protein [Williamsia sp. CHRR-6]MBT0565914.1 alpha/beta fold hydrolase [Williamsia sp. CHRR-6]